MLDEGPVRRVLRASTEFDRSLEAGWILRGKKHDVEMGLLVVFVFGLIVAFVTPWSLLASLPMLVAGGWVRQRVARDLEFQQEHTQDSFDRYRTVLEDSLTAEDYRCKANGAAHPLSQQGSPEVGD